MMCSVHCESCRMGARSGPASVYRSAPRKGNFCRAISKDVLRFEPPSPGDLFVLEYESSSRLYFETVLVKRKPKLLCQGRLFSLELEPEGAYPRLSEAFVKSNPVLHAGLDSVRRMQKNGDVMTPDAIVHGLETREVETRMTKVGSFSELAQRVRSRRGMWCDGTGPNDAPLTDDEQALLTAGELVALAEGLRGVALLQVSLPSEMGGSRLPLLRPFVFHVLKMLHEDSKRILMLPSKVGGVDGATSLVVAAKRQPFNAWAAYLANLGVQASLVAESEFYKMIIGIMMGYKREHIEHHIREATGRPVDGRVQEAVEEELRGLSGVEPSLPWK